MRKVINEGGVLPDWYGVAWDDYGWGGPAKVVCYPIPLNVLLGALRSAWLYCRSNMRFRYSSVAWLTARVKRLTIELEIEKKHNALLQEKIAQSFAKYFFHDEGEEWKDGEST
jgi:hypothetical protein